MNSTLIKSITLIVLYLSLSSVQTNGTEVPSKSSIKLNNSDHALPHFSEKIEVDGNIDEEVWSKALTFTLDIETKPGENIAAPVKTTVYIYEDGENLNLAFIADDPEPEKIRSHYHDHDFIFDDDLVGFKVDTYHDTLRSYQFFVNALGVKHDSIEDGVTKQDDMSWNAIWDAAAIYTEKGFQVEISVPLRILRFDDSLKEQQWGFDLLRFYPRDLRHRISHRKLDRNNSCTLCQLDTFSGLSDVTTGKNLSIVPFLTAAKNEHRDDPLTDPWTNSEATEVGADIRWGITANTTLNATLNPDFSQIESDVAQLDINNTFSLFFPEKRPFFIEGSDYYNTPMNVVYTRNISDPDYGFKLTSSSDNNNYAAFVTNDTSTTYLLPGNLSSNIASFDQDSTNAVFRYRRDLDNSSSIGSLLTLRQGGAYSNLVVGIDGVYRLSDSDVLRAQLMQSKTEDPVEIVEEFSLAGVDSSGTALKVNYRHENRDWNIWGNYSYVDAGFRADLGFIPKVDFKKYSTGAYHKWYADNKDWWNEFSFGMRYRRADDLDDQKLESQLRTFIRYQGPLQSNILLHYSVGDEYWNNRLYNTDDLRFELDFRPFPSLQFKLDVESKQSIDYTNSQPAEIVKLTPSFKFNIGQHFQTDLRFTKLHLDVAGGELFNSTLIDARLVYQFSVQSFLRFVVQYRKTNRNPDLYLDEVETRSKNLSTQLLYSYKFNQQTVFFLGYSDASFEDEQLRELLKTDKTIFLKMSYSLLY